MIKEILGVKIDDITLDDALTRVVSFLKRSDLFKVRPFLIVTPGPEFLLTATKDAEFRNILNSADLSLPDGFGLQLYAGIKNRVPGRNFMAELCREAVENNWSIGLLGGWSGEGKKAKENLEKKFPGIKVSEVIDGAEATKVRNGSEIDRYITKSIDILFVGLGHPWQEKVISKIGGRTNSGSVKIRVAMGVGGAIDYLAGRYPEPPGFFQALGLEWLWRLTTQMGRPDRWHRVLAATFVFPLALWHSRH